MTVQEMVDSLNSGSSEKFFICCQLEEMIDNNNIEETIDYLQKHFNCDRETANQTFIEFKKQIYDEFKKIENENPLSPEQIAYNNAVAKELLNKPKCPTCSSTNLREISITSKIFDTAMYGIFGTKRNKTFHCNNCGYEW